MTRTWVIYPEARKSLAASAELRKENPHATTSSIWIPWAMSGGRVAEDTVGAHFSTGFTRCLDVEQKLYSGVRKLLKTMWMQSEDNLQNTEILLTILCEDELNRPKTWNLEKRRHGSKTWPSPDISRWIGLVTSTYSKEDADNWTPYSNQFK